MLVSIIIPTFNRRELVLRALHSLCAQRLPSAQFEVIVVVDGSNDGSASALQQTTLPYSLRILQQENRGQTVALNAGARAAGGRFLLFLDDDLTCDSSLLTRHVECQGAANDLVVFGRTEVDPESGSNMATEWVRANLNGYYSRLDRHPQPIWPYDAWVGPNCSLARTLFMDNGGYDEARLPRRCEDVELGLRLWKRGARFQYEPRAVAYHLCKETAEELVRGAAKDAESLTQLCQIHPEYRPHTSWGRLGSSLPKTLVLRLTARFPLAETILISLSLWTTKYLFSRLGSQRLARKILGWGFAVATVRGAVRVAGSWMAFREAFMRRVSTLLYHHVGTTRHDAVYPEMTISPEVFEEQIAWLARHGYRGITPSQWLAWRVEGTLLPRKCVLITFDDALADIAKHALPVLERYGFGAAVFAISDCITLGTPWEGYPVMTASEIATWSKRGIEFGAHTLTHPDLRRVEDPRLDDEIAVPADILGRMTGGRVDLFAYPYGLLNPEVHRRVRERYSLAFTCDEGLNDLSTDPHLLRRTMVQPNDWRPDFILRVVLGRSPIMDIRSKLRVRDRVRWVAKRLRLLAR